MLPVTAVELNFADGRYRFWLGLSQGYELENKLAAMGGPATTICGLEWYLRQSIALTDAGKPVYTGGEAVIAQALRETIRLALIGGNHAVIDGGEQEVGPKRAQELLDAYVFPTRPIGEAAALTWRILAAAVYGNDPEGHPLAGVSDLATQEGPTDG